MICNPYTPHKPPFALPFPNSKPFKPFPTSRSLVRSVSCGRMRGCHSFKPTTSQPQGEARELNLELMTYSSYNL